MAPGWQSRQVPPAHEWCVVSPSGGSGMCLTLLTSSSACCQKGCEADRPAWLTLACVTNYTMAPTAVQVAAQE